MRAASIEWDEARANILKVAEMHDALAQTIEDIAERELGRRHADATKTLLGVVACVWEPPSIGNDNSSPMSAASSAEVSVSPRRD